MDQNDSLAFRLDVINKLISLERLEKERRRRSQYQETLIGKLSQTLLDLESNSESKQPWNDVDSEEFTRFTSLNKDVIDEIEHRLRERPDGSYLLAQYQQVIENIKQIPHISQTQTFRLKREALEERLKALIRHSEVLLSSNHNQTKDTMSSCLKTLKIILMNTQQLPRHKTLDKQTVNMNDTKLASRLNCVRDNLLQLHGKHNKYIESLATIDDKVAEVLSIYVPPMAPLEKIIDSITTSKAIVKFCEENIRTEQVVRELQIRGSFLPAQTNFYPAMNILVPLQEAISVFLNLHSAHDPDIESLNNIWKLEQTSTENDKE
ncbi:hypothetical protein JR316_0004832 [Psilocybe cubensis]|uniref:Uncharacterized protein n=1 Tax=Psilocybe cubensis TaxID=181762 RepID=A0ACB8H4Z9_PSICU|nr:hypothetical protein JR316_0004832 [Psilocybe cubensis]KAH9482732.1 hypothetical protein JR316_0004832 [Psilocybe cubensis]